MDKSPKEIKFSQKNKKIIIIAALLVIVITLSIALGIYFTRGEDTPRPESLDARNLSLEYSFVDVMLFNNKINNSLRTHFYISDTKNFVSSRLILAFSEARIPADKLQNFGDYFSEFCVILRENGLSIVEGNIVQGAIGTVEESFKGFSEKINYFFEKTQLSEVEAAKIIYHLLRTNSGSENFSAVLDSLGQNNFVTITANTISAVKLTATSATDLGEARMVQTLLGALGSNYLEIESLIGYSGLETLLGLDYNLEESFGGVEGVFSEYVRVINSAENLVANLVYFTASSLEKSEVAMLEKIYEYNDLADKGTEESKRLFSESRILLAKAITSGLTASLQKSHITGISDVDGFISVYSQLFTESRKVSELFYGGDAEIDFEEYQSDTEQLLQDFFAAAYRLNAVEPNLASVSAEELQKIYSDALIMNSYNEIIGKPLESVLVLVYINGVLKLSSLQEQILENFKYVGA